MKKLNTLLLAAILAAGTFSHDHALAANGTWSGDRGGSWADPANWTGGIIADGVDAIADFSTVNITANRTVTLDGDVTIGHLLLADATTGQQDWIFSSGTTGALVMAVSSGVPTIEMPVPRVNNDFVIQFDVDIQGTQGVMFVGDGDATASGRFRFRAVPKTYSGDTVLTNGAKLQLENDFGPEGAIPDGPGKGDLRIYNGPSGQLSRFIINQSDEVVNGLWGDGRIDKDNNASNTLSVGNNDASSEFRGTLSQQTGLPFNFRKIGAGTFTFNGGADGTYAGTFFADGGTLLFGPDALIPLGATLAAGAGLLELSPSLVIPECTIAGDGPVVLAPLTLNSITLSPGVGSTPGTLILSNSVTVGGLATNVFHLDTTTTVGSGVNDLLIINGDLDLAFTTLQVRLRFLEALPGTNAQYTIIKYTGSLLNGSAASFIPEIPAFMNATFDTSTPNEVRVSFNYTLSNRDLVWNAPFSPAPWDEGITPNWLFTGNPVAFISGDRTWFTNEAVVSATNEVTITDVVLPRGVTVGGTNDYIFTGEGYFVGNIDVVKNGTGSLSISNANRYDGTTYVNNGILRAYSTSALGRTNGPTIIAPGGTLDLNAVVGQEPILVSGHGFNGMGALIRSETNNLPDDTAFNVTLTGDTTVAAPGDRWDIQALAETDRGLNAAGFKITKIGPGQFTIAGTVDSTNVADTALGDLEITEGVVLLGWGLSLGQPDKSILVHSNATLRLNKTGVISDSGTNVLFKNVFLTNATFQMQASGGNAEYPVLFGGTINVNGECILQAANGFGNFLLGPIAGPGSVLKTGGSAAVLSASNSFAGPLIITQNKIRLANPGGLCLNVPSIILEATNGSAYFDIQANEQIVDSAVVTLTNANSGDCRFALKGFNETIAGIQGNRGSGGSEAFLQAGVGTEGDSNLVSTLTLITPNATVFDFGGVVRDQAGGATGCTLHITKDGPGTQIFSAAASYTGTTTIKNGTLAFTADAVDGSPIVLQGGTIRFGGAAATFMRTNSITGTGSLIKDGDVSINLQGTASFTGSTLVNGGLLAVNGTLGSGSGTVTVQAGTLGGSGSILDPVTILNGGTLAPGNSSGSLSIPSLVLQDGSTTVMELEKFSPEIEIPDQIINLTSVTYGGTLQVVNITTAYPIAAGDEFRLFSSASYSGNFTNISLPPLGGGLTWQNTLTTDGYLRVIQSTPTSPTNITWSVSANEITISWPQAYTGWYLQSQTNQLSVGLSGNWVTIPGSDQTNSITLPVVSANPAVFYRMSLQP